MRIIKPILLTIMLAGCAGQNGFFKATSDNTLPPPPSIMGAMSQPVPDHNDDVFKKLITNADSPNRANINEQLAMHKKELTHRERLIEEHYSERLKVIDQEIRDLEKSRSVIQKEKVSDQAKLKRESDKRIKQIIDEYMKE